MPCRNFQLRVVAQGLTGLANVSRLLANAMRAAERAIREDLRLGAKWVDAHLVRTTEHGQRADILVDSSIGFDELRHPTRGASPLPPTSIVVVVTSGTEAA